MKYILTLFAVVMLVAYSNASPHRKHDIEKCHKKVSGFLTASGSNHDPGHLKTILKCFERNDFDACNADIKSNAQNMAILEECQSEIEGLVSFLPFLTGRNSHGDGIAKRSKSSKSSSSSSSSSSSDCDCNGVESLVMILSELVSQVGMADDDCDALCILSIILGVLESESDAVECVICHLSGS